MTWQANGVSRRFSRRVAIALVGCVLAVAGCKGDGATSNDEPLDQRMAAAKKAIDRAHYIGFTLSTPKLPSGLDTGLLSASGTGTHTPGFAGKIKADASGLNLDVDVIAIGGTVHVKLPFVGWSDVDPAKYGAPDPSALMSARTGISSLLTAATNLHNAGQERSGSAVLTKVSGTIPGAEMHKVFPSADLKDFAVTFKLNDNDEVQSAVISGPFYQGYDNVTYNLSVNLNADKVDIKAP